jgi:hypothetical protein
MNNLLDKASDLTVSEKLSEPLEVLAFLLDAVETYGLDYMHGLPKAEYVDAAKRAIERLERERLYTEAETLAAIKRALEGAANAAYHWWDAPDADDLRHHIRYNLDPAQFIEEPKP